MLDPIIIYSTLLKLVFAFGAYETALWLLRRMDRRCGIDWNKHVWNVLKTNPMALAVYFGARFLGVSLLVGLVIS